MKWQPIETAPKDCFILLAWDGDVIIGYWDGNSWVPDECRDEYGNDYRTDLSPTHWMPLPEAPKVAVNFMYIIPQKMPSIKPGDVINDFGDILLIATDIWPKAIRYGEVAMTNEQAKKAADFGWKKVTKIADSDLVIVKRIDHESA